MGGCTKTKCLECPVVMKACNLIDGLCPSCHAKKEQ